eukprot:g1325.t1
MNTRSDTDPTTSRKVFEALEKAATILDMLVEHGTQLKRFAGDFDSMKGRPLEGYVEKIKAASAEYRKRSQKLEQKREDDPRILDHTPLEFGTLREQNELRVMEGTYRRLQRQVRLLMWKSFIEKKRSWYSLIGQGAGPIAMCFLLIVFYEVMFNRTYQGFLEELFMPAALIIVIPTVTTTVVAEKSTRLTESMKMMGLTETAYFLNLLLVEGIIFGAVMGAIVGGIAKVPNFLDDYEVMEYRSYVNGTEVSMYTYATAGLFANAPFFDVFLSIFVFCVCSVPFGFLMSVFFSTARFAGQISFVICLGLVLFNMSYNLRESGRAATLIASAFPPLGYSMFIKIVVDSINCENGDCRIEYELVRDYDKNDILAAMISGASIFSVLSWYLRNVLPSEFGAPKKWYFCLRCSSRRARNKSTNAVDDDDDDDDNLLSANMTAVLVDGEGKDNDNARKVANKFEPLPKSLKASRSVRVRNLRKTFHGGDGKLVAVNDLSFDLVEGQVFSLLGHNGAGKTTTISMLTGLIPPDTGHGATTVYGSSISDDLDSVRTVLGICPQHDVLMPTLTSFEHIIFFAMLKGSTHAAAKKEAEDMLASFNLSERRDHFGSGLSGGMRRKLSTIIALCAGSKFCILDEPSSGMDPLARRELWDSINACKRNRTILLTTHYMDEADELGDRIGIMSHGVMQTIGSSSFLKRRFGCGYVLECEKVDAATDSSKIVNFVKDNIAGATFNKRESYERQLIFELPFESVGEFGKFFDRLDKNLAVLGVEEYGVSITSMEDVFLEVGRDGRKQKRKMSVMRRRSSTRAASKEPDDESDTVKRESSIHLGVANQKRASLRQQAIVLVRKRLWTARNDYFRSLVMLLMPCAILLAVFLLNSFDLFSDNDGVGNATTAWISLGAFLFLPGLIAGELVRERASKLRYTLSVMGAKQLAYFAVSCPPLAIGMFLGDYVGWSIITILTWLIVLCVGGSAYLSGGGILLLMPLYGAQLISFSYCVSFMYSRPTLAIVGTPMLLLLLAFLSQVIVGIFLVAASDLNTEDSEASDYIEPFALFTWSITFICPIGSLGTGLLACTLDWENDDQFPHIGAVLAIMIIYSIGFMALAIHLDSRTMKKLVPKFEKNSDVSKIRKKMHADVLKEAMEVEATDPKSVALQLKQLRKVYPKRGPTPETVAVQGLSLQVKKRSILCLLGPNGAGKSTTLNMLLRAVSPTSGDASVCGHSMLSDFERGAVSLGVVPQDNNLWPLLTCEQHLRLFAMLRGVPASEAGTVVKSALMHMELAPKARTLSKALSGGMQRRLCTAIALIGNPDVVLLDEPSAGLDPVARRNLWDVIRETMGERAVILTTHSMEEADALSTRIAIMAYGSLQCVGTSAHLKKTMGSDFEIVIKMKKEMEPLEQIDDATPSIQGRIPTDVTDFMRDTFGEYAPASVGGFTCVFDVKKERVVIGRSFAAFHANKERLGIEDFSISQPTLEQVFIKTVLKAKREREGVSAGGAFALGSRVVDRRSFDNRRSSSFSSKCDVDVDDDADGATKSAGATNAVVIEMHATPQAIAMGVEE